MNRKLTQTVIMGVCCMLFLGACSSLSSESRERLSFNDGWLFSLADDSLAARPEFVDSGWRKLNLPHDWAIEGDIILRVQVEELYREVSDGIGKLS